MFLQVIIKNPGIGTSVSAAKIKCLPSYIIPPGGVTLLLLIEHPRHS